MALTQIAAGMVGTLSNITISGNVTTPTINSTGALSLQTGGTTAITVDASQNVVVAGNFSVGQSPVGGTKITANGAITTTNFLTVDQTNAGGMDYFPSQGALRFVSYGSTGVGGNITFQTGLGGGPGATERMRIDFTGNIGMGTTTPGFKIDAVTGTLGASVSNVMNIFRSTTATGNNDAFEVLYNRTIAGTGWSNADLILRRNVDNTASQGAIAFGSENSVKFYTNAAERVRIDNLGNMQIGYGGQSTTAFTAPQGIGLFSLDNTAIQIHIRKGNQVEGHIGFKTSTDTNFYVGPGGGAGPGGIGAYGLYIVNNGTAWTSVSDERSKTELEPITDALAKVATVRSVTGRYNHDEENGVTKRRSFLIAQDFLPILPEAVNEQDPEEYGLSYTDTIPLLYAAVNELQTMVKEQADVIAALKLKAGL